LNIDESNDFIILGSESTFSKLSVHEISDCTWQSQSQDVTLHEWAGKASENIISKAVDKISIGNLTTVAIMLKGALDFQN